MSIKRVKPSKASGYVQGYYKPVNPEKYVGPMPIIYRSSWERKFMIYCDSKVEVVSWSSEPVEIKYWYSVDNREHTYNPDFYMKTEVNGKFTEYLVEIKPESHLVKPTPPTKNTKKALENYKYIVEQYVKNRDKYVAAKAWAEDRKWKFIVLTEKSLK
jgi:hypothetical protein